jgi:hypothetical protein
VLLDAGLLQDPQRGIPGGAAGMEQDEQLLHDAQSRARGRRKLRSA